MKKVFLTLKIILVSLSLTLAIVNPAFSISHPHRQIILFIWDGLRPDAVSPRTTPTLYTLMKNGVEFLDNHSTYPTFTMMNAASFATGDRAGKTGFYGNSEWSPGIVGVNSAGIAIDFLQPVFTEDYKILQDLNQDKLLLVPTLFSVANRHQIKTAVVGKSGPAFIQDYLSQGIILDEKQVYPLAFAKQLQQANYALPKNSPLRFPKGKLTLSSDNGDPTAATRIYFLADGVTSNPKDNHGSPYSLANRYLMKVYLNEILTKRYPQFSVIWLRNPDTTEHVYGPGSANYWQSLHDNDKLLGKLINKLKKQNVYSDTDIIIASDHSHSSVSGSLDQFPLRTITHNRPGVINPNGYSVSGNIRSADLLSKAGFHAYDGSGCQYSPVMSGIKADGSSLYPEYVDHSGKICGKKGTRYTSPSYKVPKGRLSYDTIIVAANGGSDYFYVPSHNKNVVIKLVRFLQSRTVFDAIFVDKRYGELNGTLSLATIGIQNSKYRNPDVIAGFSYDAIKKINRLPGIEYSDWPNYRGNHGSFSPIDVHNFLTAIGPDFRRHFQDHLPTNNIDVPPTIAYLLGMHFSSEGRILQESLVNSQPRDYQVHDRTLVATTAAQNLKTYNSLNQLVSYTTYQVFVQTKILMDGNTPYLYFESAKAYRK